MLVEITIKGPQGSGKTQVAVCLAKYLRGLGCSVASVHPDEDEEPVYDAEPGLSRLKPDFLITQECC